MAVFSKPGIDDIVKDLLSKTPQCRTTIFAISDVESAGEPAEDAAWFRDKFPEAAASREEMAEVKSFFDLKVIPSMPEVMEALNFYSRITRTKANGSGAPSNLKLVEGELASELTKKVNGGNAA